MKVKSVPVQVKAGPEDGLQEGEFIVYPSTFIRQADAYGDVVAKGAFLDDIEARKEAGSVLPGLFGHRMDDPDFFVAYAIEEGEDDNGWWVKGAFDLDSPKSAQVYRLVKGRRITQLSFAYDVLEESEITLEDGSKANELRRLKVYEFSFVPVGANQDTSVLAVKGGIDALQAAIKAGRVLSAKNVDTLREAREALNEAGTLIDSLIAAADGDDDEGEPKSPDDGSDAQATASGTTDANDEAGNGKSEEPKSSPSARVLAAHNHLSL